MIRSSILKALSDGIEEIDAIQAKTQIEMNILLATLLELELTGTLENIGAKYTGLLQSWTLLFTELNKKQDGTQFLCRRRQKNHVVLFKKFQIYNHPADFNHNWLVSNNCILEIYPH